MTKKSDSHVSENPNSHISEPIDRRKALSGNSRAGQDAPPEVQQKVVDIIIEEGRSLALSNSDIAYYLAIAARESGFNPDAANSGTTASGVAQIIDSTGKTFGVDDTNRFDARASIKAGLSYFKYLKKKVIAEYGAADGDYMPLVYYRYHYGEFSTKRLVLKKPQIFAIRPFEELRTNKKYEDSKSVVDEARRIEKILNGNHGLKIRLEDVMGSPMSGRKAIIVQRKLVSKPDVKATEGSLTRSDKKSEAPLSPQLNPGTQKVSYNYEPNDSVSATDGRGVANEQTALDKGESTGFPEESALSSSQEVQLSSGTAGNRLNVDAEVPESGRADEARTDADITSINTNLGYSASNIKGACTANSSTEEWEFVAYEVVTDGSGYLPEVITKAQEPFLLLIPRIDYAEYNKAVMSGAIEEEGNKHRIEPNDGEAVTLSEVKQDQSNQKTDSVENPPVSLAPEKLPLPNSRKLESLKIPGEATGGGAAPSISQRQKITFDDVVSAVKKNLGWQAVYETSFAYVKQFYTRPKLPPAPLSQAGSMNAGPARIQVVTGSLPNKETKTGRTKEQVTTAKNEPATAPVELKGDASWMNIALAEQKKGVRETPGNQLQDANWLRERVSHNSSIKEIKQLKQALSSALKKKESASKISDLEDKIRQQEEIRDNADKKMRELELPYNNSEILKYLNSTSLSGSELARNDGTAWCSSFVNWCLIKAGVSGTNNALADSWKNWGRELSEPKYGAITVVTRAKTEKDYLYHVGFFLGIVEKNIPDGFEEIEQKDKNGNVKIVKKRKFRKVKHVNLLSGNFSRTISEFADWTVSSEDDPQKHLVSYRWPK